MNGIQQEIPSNAVEVSIDESKEYWSEYKLADGTILRVKPAVVAVFHIPGQYTPDGEPVYTMKTAMITDIRGAKKLKRKP